MSYAEGLSNTKPFPYVDQGFRKYSRPSGGITKQWKQWQWVKIRQSGVYVRRWFALAGVFALFFQRDASFIFYIAFAALYADTQITRRSVNARER